MKPCWCGGEVRQCLTGNGIYCVESPFHDPHSTGLPERIDTLYVAGPMSGYPDANMPLFNEVSERLRDVGFKVVSPAEVHLERCHYLDLIRADLKVMLDCHAVAVLPDWWNSPGARNEVNLAGFLKMPIRPWQEWIERAHQELS